MAAEKTGLHDLPVVCTAPASPEKETSKVSKDTHIKVLGVVLVVAIVVAGFVGVVHLLSTSESRGASQVCANSQDDGPRQDVDTANEKDAVVTFDVDGKSHEERVSVKNDGQLVTIDDRDDGFSVILDYKEGVAVMKNTSSNECYFLRIENFPDYQTDDMDNLSPVVVENKEQDSAENPVDKPLHSLVKTGVIPTGFMEVTSDTSIGDQCSDSTSYWLEEPTETSVQKRSGSICVCLDIWIFPNGYIYFYYYYCLC
ncbi:hypothetical protein HOLleu_42672 [Holothuria leucospilota]|uniref:BRICHOS domain-containing protein n=1 Tax=Holothuria leucospilota TaxID=206669 RepID=A0A9Q0YEM1_HOLLE|nr:hypothetical protein HOLleu_42672 [Holothuria leucospilota]